MHSIWFLVIVAALLVAALALSVRDRVRRRRRRARRSARNHRVARDWWAARWVYGRRDRRLEYRPEDVEQDR